MALSTADHRAIQGASKDARNTTARRRRTLEQTGEARRDTASGEHSPTDGAGQIFGEIERNSQEVVRVQLRLYQGKRYVDVRTYYWDESGDVEELQPTKKGISLKVERLPELRAALDALAAAVAQQEAAR